MPTAYQHYNNLRADALRFGQSEANAVTVGEMMSLFVNNMNLEIIEPKRLRVAASAAAPVGIMIGGYPLLAAANVDLPAGSAPSGSAAEYYVFAVRSSGQTGFSLDVNTTPTETSSRRIIGRCYYDGVKIVKESIRTLEQERNRGASNGVAAQVIGGRLTLVSGSAVMDAGASATIYYTPYENGRIGLYVPGFGWKVYSFSEASLPLDGLTAGNYDLFAANAAGEGSALSLSAVKWSTDLARSTAVVKLDGVWVRNGSPEQRYLGTIRLYATATTTDNPERRFVWNAYNRAPRRLFKPADAGTWTYNTYNTWRAANGSSANRVEVVVGLEDAYIEVGLSCTVGSTGGAAMVGVCRDGADQPSAVDASHVICGYMHNGNTAAIRSQVFALNRAPVEAGYHYYQWVEWAASAAASYWGVSQYGLHGLNGVVMG